jgi:spore coat protein U-like protein
MDEQGNNTGLNNCEKSGGGGGGWDSGSVTYRVRFKVPASCALVSTPTIDFGNLNVGPVPAGGVVANGGIVVKCTSGTPYTVYLGDGNQRITGGGYRQMANGSARLAYQLYKNSAHTQIWDATGGTGSVGGSGGQSSTGTGASQTWTVYGWIPTGVTVPGTTGTYTDTVVVTVTY